MKAIFDKLRKKAKDLNNNEGLAGFHRAEGIIYAIEEIEKWQKSKEAKAERRIAYAGEFLCETDGVTIEEQVKLIEETAKTNPMQMIDYIDGVTVWEKVEYSFTCKGFLEHINVL